MTWEESFRDSLTYKLSKAMDDDAYRQGHSWKRDDLVYPDGYVSVDLFAYNIGKHNGPECATCGYSFCHHCGDPTGPCGRPVEGIVEKLSEVERMKRSG